MAIKKKQSELDQAIELLEDALAQLTPSTAELNEWEYDNREFCAKSIRKFLKVVKRKRA